MKVLKSIKGLKGFDVINRMCSVTNVKSELYVKMVMPTLTYEAEIWGRIN